MRGRLALWRLWYFFCITITTILFIKFTKTVFSQNCHVVLSYHDEDDISIFCITITTKYQSSQLIKFKGDLSQEEQRCFLGDETVSGAFAHRQKVSSVFIVCQILIVILMLFKGGFIRLHQMNVIQRGLIVT